MWAKHESRSCYGKIKLSRNPNAKKEKKRGCNAIKRSEETGQTWSTYSTNKVDANPNEKNLILRY